MEHAINILKKTLFGQTFFHGDDSVTGRVVVMQHPSIRNLWPDRMKPFAESFKGLTTVLLINCLSLRNEFLMNKTLTVEKNKLTWIWFSIWPLLLSSGAVSCSCATPNFVGWFRDRTGKSTIHHLLWHVWKENSSFSVRSRRSRHTFLRGFLLFVGEVFWNKLCIFGAFKKVQLHIPPGFPFVRWWGFLEPALHFWCVQAGPGTHSSGVSFCSLVRFFWNQLCTNFLHAKFLGQNVVDGSVMQIQRTTDHSDCQTSIRPH